MAIINLPTDLLRTFVTVIEVRNYTRAAELLSRSQPAISLQIKRLEELLGYKLILQSGRSMVVSERGEALAMHARQILQLNDQALGLFESHAADETLRVGLPLDYAVRLFQRKLTSLCTEQGAMDVRIRCDLSSHLLESLLRDEIDMVVALFQGSDQQFLVRSWRENPFWVGPMGRLPEPDCNVPLVSHPTGCVYRERMTDALKLTQRGWDNVFISPSIEAVQQAVCDGLGFTSLTSSTLQSGMQRIDDENVLPALEPLKIGLFYRQTRLGAAGNRVARVLIDTIEGDLGTQAT